MGCKIHPENTGYRMVRCNGFQKDHQSVAAFAQREAEFGRHDAAAARGGVAGDAYFHVIGHDVDSSSEKRVMPRGASR